MIRHPQALLALLPISMLSVGVLLAPGAAFAETPEAESSDDVPVFSVRPVRRMPALLPPVARPPEAPAPAAEANRKRILQALGGAEMLAEGSDSGFERLRLSARQINIPEQAHLSLVNPHTVHPDSPIVFDADNPGSAAVRLSVVKGGAYLLDFAVTATAPGDYRLAVEGKSRTIGDPAATAGHVLMGLVAEADGWATVRLDRGDTAFDLHSVEISRVR